MDLFEMELRNAEGARKRILVVARGEAEAHDLLRRHAGDIAKIADFRGFTVRGRGRVLGPVETHAP